VVDDERRVRQLIGDLGHRFACRALAAAWAKYNSANVVDAGRATGLGLPALVLVGGKLEQLAERIGKGLGEALVDGEARQPAGAIAGSQCARRSSLKFETPGACPQSK